MAKSLFAKFRKTADVIDHVLTVHSIEFVDSVFGETFYINGFDNNTEEKVIVTGGSKALISQLKSVEDIEGAVVRIIQRGKSYEIVEHEA